MVGTLRAREAPARLKCKEVWVEGSYAFRNPSEDMPGDRSIFEPDFCI